jgi:hypothetical protein
MDYPEDAYTIGSNGDLNSLWGPSCFSLKNKTKEVSR